LAGSTNPNAEDWDVDGNRHLTSLGNLVEVFCASAGELRRTRGPSPCDGTGTGYFEGRGLESAAADETWGRGRWSQQADPLPLSQVACKHPTLFVIDDRVDNVRSGPQGTQDLLGRLGINKRQGSRLLFPMIFALIGIAGRQRRFNNL
jgi:hypothetical protein